MGRPRQRKFKKVSISFPIDLYAKVVAAVDAAPPASMSSWVVEACLTRCIDLDCGSPPANALNPLPTVGTLKFHSEAFAMVVPPLSPAKVEEFKEVVRDQRAAEVAASIPGVQVGIPEFTFVDPAEITARIEFGPKTLAVAAKHVPGWSKWDWAKRLEHLRELKAAAGPA